MTIPVRDARRVVTNSGYTEQITVNIKIENEGQVRVFADEAQLAIGAHFSISGVNDPAGFTVNFNNPEQWSDVDRFAVVVRYPVNQPSDVDLGGQFGLRFENALDRLGYNDQTLADGVRLAIKMPYTTPLETEVFVETPRPGYFLQWNSTGDKLINALPDGDGNGGDISDWAAYFAPPGSIKNLQLNGALEQGAPAWPTTAKQEYQYAFSGGNPARQLPRYAGTDLAQCLLMPPAEDQTNFVAPTTPWHPFGGTNRRIMPLDIRTVLFNQLESPQLFEPVDVNGFGILTWRYVGPFPIHTIIEGTLEMMIQTSLLSDAAQTRTILRIACDPATVPFLELGQNNGVQSLASASAALRTSARFADLREFNDPGGPVTPEILAHMAGRTPEYYVGSDPGFFEPGDTTEALKLVDPNGPVGPEVRTTKWMDVSGMNKVQSSLAMSFSGTSFRGRMQVKRADGSIYTLSAGSWDTDAKRVYPVPDDAAFVRIYYTGRGASVDDGTITVKDINFLLSANNDPLKGFWDRRTFAVKRDVTFWPGGVYALEFLTLVADGGTARDWAFRCQGGGLSFLFDAGEMRKAMMQKMYREG